MFASVHYLSRLLQGTSILFALSSCALFSGPSSTSLPLQNADTAGWKELQTSPYVYEISNGSSGSTFLTAIKECEQKKQISPLVATRQLLVGLKEIRIESQETTTVAKIPTLRTQVRARLEDRPLDLLTYTLSHERCVYDFVLWRTPQLQSEGSAELLNDDTLFAKFLSQHLMSFVE